MKGCARDGLPQPRRGARVAGAQAGAGADAREGEGEAVAAGSRRSGSSSRRCRAAPAARSRPVAACERGGDGAHHRVARLDVAVRVLAQVDAAAAARRPGRESRRACPSSCCSARSARARRRRCALATLPMRRASGCRIRARSTSRPALASIRGDDGDVLRLAVVRGAGDRELVVVEAEAVGRAAGDERERLQDLDGRARKDRPIDVAERDQPLPSASSTATAPRCADSRCRRASPRPGPDWPCNRKTWRRVGLSRPPGARRDDDERSGNAHHGRGGDSARPPRRPQSPPMSAAALALVLAAALLHALWNVVEKKTGGDARFALMAALLLVVRLGAARRLVRLGCAAALGRGRVGGAAGERGRPRRLLHGPCCVATGLADLTVVYPVARGTGPLLASLGAIVWLGEAAGSVVAAAGGCRRRDRRLLHRRRPVAVGEDARSTTTRARPRAGLLWGGLTGAPHRRLHASSMATRSRCC